MEASRIPREQLESALRLRNDHWLFATSCLSTVDESEPDLRLKVNKPFPRWAFLRELSASLRDNRNVIILKPRQMFISWLVVSWALHRVLWNRGERWLVVSKREKDAYLLKSRVDQLLASLPPELAALLDRRTGDSMGEITFEGDSSLHFLPASPSIGRTFTASGVILDEFAFAPWAEEMLSSLQPTLAGGGQCIIPSTPNGVGGCFHEIWTHAEERGFHRVKLDWRQHPNRDEEWYRRTTAPLSKRMAAQEYDCDFLQSGAVVFEASYLQPNAGPSDALRAQWIREASRTRDDCPFLIGVDTAEGSDDGDYSAACVLHKDTGIQVEVLAGRWRPDVFAGKLTQLAAKYPGVIGVEKVGPGGTVILELERAGLKDRLYKHREWDQRGVAKSKLGWNTSSKSKPVMISELEAALRQGHIRLTDQATIDELTVYEYKDSASEHSGAPDGYHDDRVIALAIAYQMRKSAGQGIRSIGRA